jgi:hypothetical protein
MITRVFMPLQPLHSTTLVLFLLKFPLETLLILVLVFPKKIRRSRPLIPYIPHLFFCDISFFFILGLIVEISLLSLGLAA